MLQSKIIEEDRLFIIYINLIKKIWVVLTSAPGEKRLMKWTIALHIHKQWKC